ncbi:MAG: hypothetical protein LUG19_07985, partial [Desulfovibrio sp.]|uniref:hypothetical protein n=1 Tax=Desulfovibrio sp. TaxID=885 RepID=UPI0025850614
DFLYKKSKLKYSSGGGKQGTAHAAGWPNSADSYGFFRYWTGDVRGTPNGNVWIILLRDGNVDWNGALYGDPVAVCLP